MYLKWRVLIKKIEVVIENVCVPILVSDIVFVMTFTAYLKTYLTPSFAVWSPLAPSMSWIFKKSEEHRHWVIRVFYETMADKEQLQAGVLFWVKYMDSSELSQKT